MTDLKINTLLPSAPGNGTAQKAMGGEGFAKLLNDAVGNINRLNREANRSIADMLEGKAEVHEVMVATQKVDLSVRLLMAVRNKVIEAYKEIMHMQF